MIDKKANRLRRARATRARIRHMNVNRLTVHRTNLHIYAQIISADGKNVLCAASTLLTRLSVLTGGKRHLL